MAEKDIVGKSRTYTAIFEEDLESGGWVVRVPALPGCWTEGETLVEARAMIEDAVEGYLASLRKDNLPFPDDIEREPQRRREAVTVPV